MCYITFRGVKTMAPPTMPRPKSENDTQATLTLPSGWLDEAEHLAKGMRQPGLTVTRSDVLRMALRRGLDGLTEDAAKKRKRS